jgi:predicted kinase
MIRHVNLPTFQELYKAHSPSINVAVTNSRPMLVVFSAIPGSGKSEITKRLVNDYGFQRIANKDIRKAIEETGHSDDVVIGDYTLWLLDTLAAQGPHAIVFDRNIDQWYEPVKDWAEKHEYQFVVVQIETSRKRLEQRLLKREGSPKAKAFEVLDFYTQQHEQLRDKIRTDILLKEDYDLDSAAQKIAII